MAFRLQESIITDDGKNLQREADVIMTAAVLGFATARVKNGDPVRFEIDPKNKATEFEKFTHIVAKVDKATTNFLRRTKAEPKGSVHAGLASDYTKGAVIMGVYLLAGQTAPQSVAAPELSKSGAALYNKIISGKFPQYVGRGAYTGFVDNRNTTGNRDPVGPKSTVRFLYASSDQLEASLAPRWLPKPGSPCWANRLRRGGSTYVPWALIGGDKAQEPPDPRIGEITGVSNEADQIERQMSKEGMIFVQRKEPTTNDLVGYTHGLPQAIYKAYALGPSCTPYEIVVGHETTKLASCFPCTMFMVANGYPPTSIHLGRGESWTPLYAPYNQGSQPESHEAGVIRDLNNSWRQKCSEFLFLGLDVLEGHTANADYEGTRRAVRKYLRDDRSAPATLILDALTVHDSEAARIDRTVK
jgi:hypothetical protein